MLVLLFSSSVYAEEEKTVTLNEVIVKPKKQKYSKRNNPAVELMKNIRDSRKENSPFEMPEYSFERYEKILLGTSDLGYDFSDLTRPDNRMNFLASYIDTALWTGKRMIDLALLEKVSIMLYSKNPHIKREMVIGKKAVGISEMLNSQNVHTSMNDVLREIDIFQNDITLLQNKFVSPLSNIGPDFYKFSITDTVFFGGDQCVEVTFVPKVAETFGFNGKLYIPCNDSLKYVKRLTMRAPKAINVNYLDNIFISQNFERDSLGKVHKVLDDLSLELKVFAFIPSLYGSRQIRYRDFEYSIRGREEIGEEQIMSMGEVIETDVSEDRSIEFWESKRTIPFTYAENHLPGLTSDLRKVKIIKWGEKILRPILGGYVGTLPQGSKFNIGPVNTFISYNDFEGLRLKAGGMSTSKLSDKFFFRGYLAYGFRDHKWKYEGEIEYSFIKKKNHSREFPINAVRLSYRFDTDQIGVRYLHTSPDNVVLSLRRCRNDLVAYRRTAKLEYNLELPNNLSFNMGYQHEREDASRFVPFKNGYGEEKKSYQLGSFFVALRYTPGEVFVQTPNKRMPVNMDAPIFTLRQELGPKKLFGADFWMNQTEVSASKRFWFSAFGYSNILLKGGKIWSQVPYPALLWQNSNLSYTIQQESFALLNPMEFAMDEYFSWDIEYFINGAILNRIPFIRKAKLREVISFKGFFGHLSRRNNPEFNKDLFSFPAISHVGKLTGTPYMEASVGLDNIFTVLRVDYVWRLSYRNQPDISKSGIRVSFHLSF